MFQGAERQIVLLSILNIHSNCSTGKRLLNKGKREPKFITNKELVAPKINDIYLYPKFRTLPGFLEQ